MTLICLLIFIAVMSVRPAPGAELSPKMLGSWCGQWSYQFPYSDVDDNPMIPNDGDTKHLFIKRKKWPRINKEEDLGAESEWTLVKDLYDSNVGDVGG
jgi:hypothetical protein